jgi:beta-galactosidase
VELIPDRDTIRADGRDVAFVAVSILDRDGVPVPNADPVIRFRVEGNASIAGVDNGDPISHAPFQADSVRVFNGRAVIILRAVREPGAVTLTATAEGLDSASTRIELARAGTRARLR